MIAVSLPCAVKAGFARSHSSQYMAQIFLITSCVQRYLELSFRMSDTETPQSGAQYFKEIR